MKTHKNFFSMAGGLILSFILALSIITGTAVITVLAGTESSQPVSSIHFDANGGSGEMEDLPASIGDTVLPACQFSRYGYIFRGWTLSPGGTECIYEDQASIDISSSCTLYALWEPQLYIVRFAPGGADIGEMEEMYAIYDQETELPPCGFAHESKRFFEWRDNIGHSYRNRDTILNLHSGNTYSRKVIQVNAGKPENEEYAFRSTQGSVVYEENGRMYLVTAASINDPAYYAGDLSHYETILTKYDLETQEPVRVVRNLPFDHGNGICYCEDNGHLYIAEGGTLPSYPSGVMELDSDLNLVQEHNFPMYTHIWAIAYSNHHFYLIGRNNESRNTICTLNTDMQTLSFNEVDEYYAQNFSSQGIAADESFIYAISAGFKAYEWKTKQRINVFTHKGEYIGVWTIDIPYEAEDITVIGDYAYISTNEGAKSTLYRTRMPVVTLHAVWK